MSAFVPKEAVPATMLNARARVALCGPTGAGKTWSALEIATGLAGSRPLAVIDTENGGQDGQGRARLYAHAFKFIHVDLTDYSPDAYIAQLRAVEKQKPGAILIDSLSHAWAGEGGVLDMVDEAAARSRGNKYEAWRVGTPAQNRLIAALLSCSCHLVVTMRSKMEWVMETTVEKGERKTTVQKIGLQPVQRDGVEYEFDLVGDLDAQHVMTISKTRYDFLDGKRYPKPTRELGHAIVAYLGTNAEYAEAIQHVALKTLDGPADGELGSGQQDGQLAAPATDHGSAPTPAAAEHEKPLAGQNGHLGQSLGEDAPRGWNADGIVAPSNVAFPDVAVGEATKPQGTWFLEQCAERWNIGKAEINTFLGCKDFRKDEAFTYVTFGELLTRMGAAVKAEDKQLWSGTP